MPKQPSEDNVAQWSTAVPSSGSLQKWRRRFESCRCHVAGVAQRSTAMVLRVSVFKNTIGLYAHPRFESWRLHFCCVRI